MLKYFPVVVALVLSQIAHAATDCDVPPLPKNDLGPKAQDAAKALGATKPCQVVPGLSAKSLKDVWASLLSNKKTGGRRLETGAPPGFPNGTVVAGKSGVHFDFRDVASEEIRSFRIEADHKVLLQSTKPPAELHVPVSGSSGDTVFSWTLATRLNTYHGEFTLLNEADRRELDGQLSAIDRAGLDNVSKLLYQAAVYDDANLYSERERKLIQVRKLIEM